MFRISQARVAANLVITFDGDLIGEDARLLEQHCLRRLAGDPDLRLELGEIREIDAEGREVLRRLATRGVQLSAHGLYLSDLVRRILTAAARPA